MTVRNRTEITIETHRILTIKGRSHDLIAWCERCGEATELVTENEAAIITNIGSSAVCLPVQTAEPHLIRTPDGLFVCLNSVIK